jgi:hypothetical protein
MAKAFQASYRYPELIEQQGGNVKNLLHFKSQCGCGGFSEGSFPREEKASKTWANDLVVDPLKFKMGQKSLVVPDWKATKFRTYRRRYRKRGLGFHALNAPFAGCEGHHINVREVIFIPKEMHKRMYHNLNTGKNMRTMNVLARRFLKYGYEN